MPIKHGGTKRVGRVGANRQKIVNEKRARRPHRIKKVLKYLGVSALVCVVGSALYTQAPSLAGRAAERVSEAVNYGKRTYAEYRVVNCGRSVGERLSAAIDSLAKPDSNYVSRTEIINAAAAIPEIEKIKISKTRDKVTVIKVTERKPVAIALCGDVRLVDKKGVCFRAAPGQFYDLPLVSFGSAACDTVDLTAFNTIKKASRNLGGDFFSQISQIDFSDRSTVNLIFKSGKTEYVLDIGDMEKRMIHVKKLSERFWEEQTVPSRVDLRYRQLAFSSI